MASVMNDFPNMDNATFNSTNLTDCPRVTIPHPIFFTVSLVGLVVNLLVVVAVVHNKNLHSPMYCFICSLAGFNTIASLSKTWENLMILSVDKGHVGLYWDDLMDSLLVMSFIGTICTFLAIALDRYITIFHALRYHNIMTLRRAATILAGIWTLCTVGGVLMVHFFDYRVTMICFIVFFLVSLLLILFLYTHMFLLALMHARKIAALPGSRRQQGSRFRGALTLTILFGAFVVCWAPFFLHMLIVMVCPGNQYCGCYISLFEVHLILLLSHAIIDPAIYAFRSAELRHTIAKMLFCSAGSHPCDSMRSLTE